MPRPGGQGRTSRAGTGRCGKIMAGGPGGSAVAPPGPLCWPRCRSRARSSSRQAASPATGQQGSRPGCQPEAIW